MAVQKIAPSHDMRTRLKRLVPEPGSKSWNEEEVWTSLKSKFKQSAKDAFEIGRMLKGLRANYEKPGEFYAEAIERLNVGKITVYNHIRLYEECLGNEQVLEWIPQSIIFLFLECKIKSLREYIFENIDTPFPYSKRETIALLARYKNGEIELDHPDIQKVVSEGNSIRQREILRGIIEPARQEIISAINKLDSLARSEDRSTVHSVLKEINAKLECIKNQFLTEEKIDG